MEILLRAVQSSSNYKILYDLAILNLFKYSKHVGLKLKCHMLVIGGITLLFFKNFSLLYFIQDVANFFFFFASVISDL